MPKKAVAARPLGQHWTVGHVTNYPPNLPAQPAAPAPPVAPAAPAASAPPAPVVPAVVGPPMAPVAPVAFSPPIAPIAPPVVSPPIAPVVPARSAGERSSATNAASNARNAPGGLARPLGQHWTIGHVTDYPPLIPMAPAATIGMKPIPMIAIVAAMVAVGALALGAAVGLSLIPVFVPKRQFNATCTSQTTGTTLNINNEFLPAGSLSASNIAALQSAVNTDLDSQAGFGNCDVIIRDANVDACSSGQRLLQRRVRRGRDSFLSRQARQTNENCDSQQIDLSLVLDCHCRCVGRCLSEKLKQLSNYFLLVGFQITFPDLGNGTISITGTGVSTNSSTTTATIVSSTTASTTMIVTTPTTTTVPTTTTPLPVTPLVVG